MDDRGDDSDPTRDSGDQGPPGREDRATDVSGAPSADGRLDAAEERGVLGSLPRTRPHRASARRAASQPKRTTGTSGTSGTSAKSPPAISKRSTAKKSAPKGGGSAGPAAKRSGSASSAAKGSGPASKAAEGKASGAGADARGGAGTRASSAATTRRASPAPRRRPERKEAPRLPPRPRAPRQGYEPEEEVELGKSVNPPGPIELAESVADIFIELASASFKSGGRVLKDVLSPLRRR